MTILKQLLSLLWHSPDLIKIFIAIDNRIKKSNEQKKVREDLGELSDALKNNDAKSIRDIFNNK